MPPPQHFGTRNLGIKLRIVWSLPFHTVNKSYLKTLRPSETSPKVQHRQTHGIRRVFSSQRLRRFVPHRSASSHIRRKHFERLGANIQTKNVAAPLGVVSGRKPRPACIVAITAVCPATNGIGKIISEGSHVPDQTVTTERIACMLQLAS